MTKALVMTASTPMPSRMPCQMPSRWRQTVQDEVINMLLTFKDQSASTVAKKISIAELSWTWMASSHLKNKILALTNSVGTEHSNNYVTNR